MKAGKTQSAPVSAPTPDTGASARAAAVGADALDAARYRFLRGEAQNYYEYGDGVQLVAPDAPDWPEGDKEAESAAHKSIDAAVDAAMLKGGAATS